MPAGTVNGIHGVREKLRREKSWIEFPYLDLEEAVKTATGVQSIGRTSCQLNQLSTRLELPATGTRVRVNTARIFGLMSISQSIVTLTSLGIRIGDPEQEAAAKIDAFLTVPLYKSAYEKFKANVLPEPSELESMMESEGVPKKQKEVARRIFMRSAKQAGFFGVRHDMLISPFPQKSTGGISQQVEKPSQNHGEGNSAGRSGDFGGNYRHPLINGLMMKLPPEGEWTIEARKKWLQAASNIFDLIYTDCGEGKGTLAITIDKDSAK